MPQTATIKSLPEAFACLSRHAVSSFPDSNDMALKHGISDSLLDDRRILQALKSGTGDREDAADLRRCLAFDAITACRVLQRMARDRPGAPAAEVADEIAVLDLADRGMVKSRAPPENLDVRTFVVDAARLASFHSTPAVARDHQALAKLQLRLHSHLPDTTEQRYAQDGPGNGRGRHPS